MVFSLFDKGRFEIEQISRQCRVQICFFLRSHCGKFEVMGDSPSLQIFIDGQQIRTDSVNDLSKKTYWNNVLRTHCGFQARQSFDFKVFRLTNSKRDQVEPEYRTSTNSYDVIDTADMICEILSLK